MCEGCGKAKSAEELAAEDKARALEWARGYAWDWFEYHAGQRTSMFNYGIAAAAILAAAYGTAIEKDPIVALAIGVAGVIVCFSFFRLDERNRVLVDRGEAVLRAVEATLFPKLPASAPAHAMPSGILTAIAAESQNDGTVDNFLKGKHRLHLKWVHLVFMAAFFAGAALAWERSKQPEIPEPGALATARLAESVSSMSETVTTLSAGVDRMAAAMQADARAREAAARAAADARSRTTRPRETK